ncbi:MAG: hypothetical protein QJR06_11110 [Alicyclobacillaceae bacterium]|nr:hypothetical protein [Alicyclobacillaceae bacterium]
MYSVPFIPWRILFWAVFIYIVVAVAVTGVKDAYVINQTNHMARAMAIYQDGKDPKTGQDLTEILAQQIEKVVPVDGQPHITQGPWAPDVGNVGMRQLYIHVNDDGSFITTTTLYGAEMPVAAQLFKAIGFKQDKPIVFPAQFSYYREW